MFKRSLIVAAAFLIAMPVWAAKPETEEQKTLYALGARMARQMEVLNLTAAEYEFVKEGLSDAAAGKKLVAEPEAYEKQINQLAQTRVPLSVQKQKDRGKSYLEKAAAEKGTQKTASGLIYQEIKAGAGAQPKASDTVKVHYTGTFIDGKVFDSSVRRGQPAEFPLGNVIPCWTEGVAMMKTGAKAKLVCPSDIAYGDRGRPPVVPGGATLVFEVELLEVKALAPAAAPKSTPAGEKP
jgi:FKBP-type peptidyl-prolyl cis-trans isomerase FkpA